MGFATRLRRSGLRGGLRDEASPHWASSLGFADLGFVVGFATRRFVGSLGLRGLLGLWFFCCDGVCGFVGFLL
jgi:hypothetical protein